MTGIARYAVFPVLLASLAACESQSEQQADAMEDQIEQEAEMSAAAAGTTEAALGLTEAQLLEADLVTSDGADLGDVAQVRRDDSGAVTGLMIEVDDSEPDRYVVIPLDGLTVRPDGDDSDLQTALTAADLAGMPDAQMTTP